jgi:hypothetical protein
MKLTKLQTTALVGVPILVGAYLIYRQLRKPKSSGISDIPPPPNNNNNNTVSNGNGGSTPAPVSTFPLRKGSKNATVGTLQGLLNTSDRVSPKLVVDNDFGSKTEAALNTVYNKSQIDNQADLDALRSYLSQQSVLSNNLDWAWQIVDSANANPFGKLKVQGFLTIRGVSKNLQGQWVSNGTNEYLSAGTYSLQQVAVRSAINNGGLRIEIMANLYGLVPGMYLVDGDASLQQIISIQP